MMTTTETPLALVPNVTYRNAYLQPAFFIDEIHLHLDLHEEDAIVRSRLLVRRDRHQREASRDLFLNGDALTLVSLHCDGEVLEPSRYHVSPLGLTIHNLPDSCELVIVTRIYPQKNTALSGLYRSKNTFCTQCEAEGFRRMTYYLDHPDVLARFTTTIEADEAKYPILLSNGNPVESGLAENGRHWVTWEDPFKKPSYLFALVAGDFDVLEDQFITRSGRSVALKIYVEKGCGDQSAHAMVSLKAAMQWDEVTYGREYDLDIFMIVAISDFNMGAMENKGLNIFNTKYVLSKPATATDDDYIHILSVIGHEYFHNWSGNRVTCRDWFQLSLKEGFTVFRDQSFTEDLISPGVMRIRDVVELREAQFSEDAGPLSHPVRPESYLEIDNFYTATIYNKGAEVVRMMKTIVGELAFRKGTDAYFEKFDGQAVTIEDFVETIEDVSGVSLAQFRLWYAQSGTPVVMASEQYDANTKVYRLTLEQHTNVTQDQEEKHPLQIPVRMGLLTREGEAQALYLADEPASPAKVLLLTENEQTFEFHHVNEKPIASLFRGFSAPIKLKFDQSLSDRLFLMVNDSDAFNRFEAGQQAALSILLGLIEAYQKGNAMQMPSAFAETLSLLLTQSNQDEFLLSELLGLPSEKFIADQMTVADVDAIHAAREFMMESLSDALQSRFHEVYETGKPRSQSNAFDSRVIGARALKNRALHFLSYTKNGMRLADQQLTDALNNNMTDALSALACLNRVDSGFREQGLAVFFTVWNKDPLVLDKWFALQAISPRTGTLHDVKQLTTHPLFDWTNPNKVYALIGSFAGRNPTQFHQISGAGYVFLREAVQKLNALNPSVAARMVKPLTSWGRYDKERQAMMKRELDVLLSTKGLSNDVYELVSKSLETRV